MDHPGFFERAAPIALRALADKLGAQLAQGADAGVPIHDVRPLSKAGSGHLAFLDNRKYLAQLAKTRASACLVAPPLADRVPAGTAALLVEAPYHAFARALALFYPDALTLSLQGALLLAAAWAFLLPFLRRRDAVAKGV